MYEKLAIRVSLLLITAYFTTDYSSEFSRNHGDSDCFRPCPVVWLTQDNSVTSAFQLHNPLFLAPHPKLPTFVLFLFCSCSQLPKKVIWTLHRVFLVIFNKYLLHRIESDNLIPIKLSKTDNGLKCHYSHKIIEFLIENFWRHSYAPRKWHQNVADAWEDVYKQVNLILVGAGQHFEKLKENRKYNIPLIIRINIVLWSFEDMCMCTLSHDVHCITVYKWLCFATVL